VAFHVQRLRPVFAHHEKEYKCQIDGEEMFAVDWVTLLYEEEIYEGVSRVFHRLGNFRDHVLVHDHPVPLVLDFEWFVCLVHGYYLLRVFFWLLRRRVRLRAV